LTDITSKIKNEILKSGPIPINIFIKEALNSNKNSYYQSKKQILGYDGDFITSPEISQLFGEIIAVWLNLSWMNNFRNKRFNLCELGPGKGTLMSDLLRSINKNSEIFKYLDKIQLFEINEHLINIQQSKLAEYNISWHKDITNDVDDKINIIIANEFFDSLPVIQYIRRKKRWYELMVNLKRDSSDLYISDEPIDEKTQEMLQEEFSHVPIDGIIEILDEAKAILKDICQKLSKFGGSLIIIDYGYIEADRNSKSYISTLQAIKNHRYYDIFKDIGSTDITTQVNFSQLRQTAELCGCKTTYMTQRDFLLNYGIEIRKEILIKNALLSQKHTIQSQFQRLTDKDQMGDLFKVLIIEGKIK